MQLCFLHLAGVYDSVEVQGALGPALPEVPSLLTQHGAGLTLILIAVTEAETNQVIF